MKKTETTKPQATPTLDDDKAFIAKLEELIATAPLDWRTSQIDLRQIADEEKQLFRAKSNMDPELYRTQADKLRARKEAKTYDPAARRRVLLEAVRLKQEVVAFITRNSERLLYIESRRLDGASTPDLANESRWRTSARQIVDNLVRLNESELLGPAAPDVLAAEFADGEKFFGSLKTERQPSGRIGEMWSAFRDQIRRELAEIKQHLLNDEDPTAWSSSRS